MSSTLDLQPNAVKPTGHHFMLQMDNDPKEFLRVSKSFSRQRNWIFFLINPESPRTTCFLLTEDRTEGRKTHKQTATGVSCSKFISMGSRLQAVFDWLKAIFMVVIMLVLFHYLWALKTLQFCTFDCYKFMLKLINFKFLPANLYIIHKVKTFCSPTQKNILWQGIDDSKTIKPFLKLWVWGAPPGLLWNL